MNELEVPFSLRGALRVEFNRSVAFGLPLVDADAVGASATFPDGTWDDEKLDVELLPAIEATRSRWDSLRP